MIMVKTIHTIHSINGIWGKLSGFYHFLSLQSFCSPLFKDA